MLNGNTNLRGTYNRITERNGMGYVLVSIAEKKESTFKAWPPHPPHDVRHLPLKGKARVAFFVYSIVDFPRFFRRESFGNVLLSQAFPSRGRLVLRFPCISLRLCPKPSFRRIGQRIYPPISLLLEEKVGAKRSDEVV